MKAVVLCILALPALAHADPADEQGRTELVGGAIGGATEAGIDAAFALEGTYRLAPERQYFVRGRIAVGRATEFDGDDSGGNPHEDTMVQALGGFEARACHDETWLCLLGGVDVGYENQGDVTNARGHLGALGGADVGLDVGGDHLRARVILDVFMRARTIGYWAPGGDLSLGLGYRF